MREVLAEKYRQVPEFRDALNAAEGQITHPVSDVFWRDNFPMLLDELRTPTAKSGKPVVEYIAHMDVATLRANPEKFYLFGDNLQERGKRGQAIIRDEPNAIGIPTKKRPSMNDDAFFTDTELASNQRAIDRALNKIPSGATVVIPEKGLGTGLARLEEKAPKTFEYLQTRLDELRTPTAGSSAAAPPAVNDLPVPEEYLGDLRALHEKGTGELIIANPTVGDLVAKADELEGEFWAKIEPGLESVNKIHADDSLIGIDPNESAGYIYASVRGGGSQSIFRQLASQGEVLIPEVVSGKGWFAAGEAGDDLWEAYVDDFLTRYPDQDPIIFLSREVEEGVWAADRESGIQWSHLDAVGLSVREWLDGYALRKTARKVMDDVSAAPSAAAAPPAAQTKEGFEREALETFEKTNPPVIPPHIQAEDIRAVQKDLRGYVSPQSTPELAADYYSRLVEVIDYRSEVFPLPGHTTEAESVHEILTGMAYVMTAPPRAKPYPPWPRAQTKVEMLKLTRDIDAAVDLQLARLDSMEGGRIDIDAKEAQYREAAEEASQQDQLENPPDVD
jgi:hypothetical protein